MKHFWFLSCFHPILSELMWNKWVYLQNSGNDTFHVVVDCMLLMMGYIFHYEFHGEKPSTTKKILFLSVLPIQWDMRQDSMMSY